MSDTHAERTPMRQIDPMRVERQAARARHSFVATQARYLDRSRHLVTSHADWTRIVARADIAAVPSHAVGAIKVDELNSAWSGDAGAWARVVADLARCEQATRALEAQTCTPMVWRTDGCAALALKSQCASTGEHGAIAGARARAEQDFATDVRTAEITSMWPRATLPVHARPYVAPRMQGGWPVEMRVWIRNGRAAAVSSYYTQRPLKRTEEVERALGTATARALRLGAHCQAFDPIPHDPRYPEQVLFTADFLVRDSDGEVLWLESGPYTFAHYGADLCCIEDLATLWDNEAQGLPIVATQKATERSH